MLQSSTMAFSTANNELMLLVLLVLIALFSRESTALLSNLALTAQPYTKSLQVRQSSYQENPSLIQWPPDCTIQDATSCLGSEAVSSCTVETCSTKVAATCWTHVYFIDFQCLCGSMSSTTCTSCGGGINRELYLAWLSQYCTKDPGWDGLPNNWNDVLPAFKVLEAGEVNAVHEIDQSHFQTQNPFTSQFITDKHTFIDDHHVPTCTSLCNWLNVKWASSFVDGNVSAGLVAGGFNPTYQQGGALQAGVLYVDLSLFCTGWKWSDLQSGCPNLCMANLEPSSLLLWLNTTCGQTSGFTGLPNDWTDSLAVPNSTYTSPFSGPSCAQGGNDTNCDIPSTISSCTKSLCGSVDQNGDCNAVSMINMECFCSSINFSGCIASGGQCSSSIQETGLLLWLNTTCSNVQGFVGLPNNWQDPLYVLNSTYTDVFSRPTCLGDSNYPGCTIDSTESTYTKSHI